MLEIRQNFVTFNPGGTTRKVFFLYPLAINLNPFLPDIKENNMQNKGQGILYKSHY